MSDGQTRVGDVLPAVSPALVRRKRNCTICRSVAAIEHVNVLIVATDGTRRRDYRRAVGEYLRGMGVSVGVKAIEGHARHVMDDIANPPRRALLDRMVPVAPDGVPASWLDVNEQGLGVGMEALRDLRARLPDLDDKDLIAVAKMGLSAAGKRADIEARGRAMGATLNALAALASGHAGQISARVEHLTIRAQLGEGREGVEVDDHRVDG